VLGEPAGPLNDIAEVVGPGDDSGATASGASSYYYGGPSAVPAAVWSDQLLRDHIRFIEPLVQDSLDVII
jgi:hypothetical protein